MKLRLASANFVLFVLLMPDHQSVFCFSNIFRNMWEKKFTIGGGGVGIREGRSGYSKHAYFSP